MVIEAGLVAGYLIAWAVGKARRVGHRLDAEADGAIDASLDKLHEIVAAKLAGYPVLADLAEEAVAGDDGQVSELTRQQLELAVTAAAQKDDKFGQEVTELVARLRGVEGATAAQVVTGAGSAVSTGNIQSRADHGIAIGMAGSVHTGQGPVDPSQPDRTSH